MARQTDEKGARALIDILPVSYEKPPIMPERVVPGSGSVVVVAVGQWWHWWQWQVAVGSGGSGGSGDGGSGSGGGGGQDEGWRKSGREKRHPSTHLPGPPGVRTCRNIVINRLKLASWHECKCRQWRWQRY